MTNLTILKQDINLSWDIKRFKIRRYPVFVCSINPTFLLTYRKNVLDLLIREPGESLRIPRYMGFTNYGEGIGKFINDILIFEEKVNPNWGKYYIYLTTNNGFVRAGRSQRNPGAHFDGMQGAKYVKKFPVCHQYLVSSSLTTIYYTNSFNFDNLNDQKHNFFKECDRQKRSIFKSEPNNLYLQTAYNVHESPIASNRIYRSFIRVEFSLKGFNRLGNSINPIIKNGKYFKFEKQPIPAYLV